MDFDKPKVYGDTSITDGLVQGVGILNTYFNSIEARFKPFVFHRLHAMQQKILFKNLNWINPNLFLCDRWP